MKNVEIYTKGYCPYCHSAKRLLDQLGIAYTEYDVGRDNQKLTDMLKRSERRTVPQIFADGHHIGGNDDLQRLYKKAG